MAHAWLLCTVMLAFPSAMNSVPRGPDPAASEERANNEVVHTPVRTDFDEVPNGPDTTARNHARRERFRSGMLAAGGMTAAIATLLWVPALALGPLVIASGLVSGVKAIAENARVATHVDLGGVEAMLRRVDLAWVFEQLRHVSLLSAVTALVGLVTSLDWRRAGNTVATTDYNALLGRLYSLAIPELRLASHDPHFQAVGVVLLVGLGLMMALALVAVVLLATVLPPLFFVASLFSERV